MCNAELEGGPRNGVMTGLDDFMAEHDRPLRRVVLPIYFGLAIVAEEERLARTPALARELDRLESLAGKDDLLELAEETRISALIFQHGIYFQRERQVGRIAGRYLDTVTRALTDELYGVDGEPDAVPYAPLGRGQLDQLRAVLDTVRNEPVRGDLVDCGVARGGAAIFLRAYLAAYELDRQLFLVDPSGPKCARDGLERFGLLDDRTHFLGADSETSPGAWIDSLALVHLGPGLGERVRQVLEHLYKRLTPGGFVVVDDLGEEHVRDAVEGFRTDHGITSALEAVGASGTSWRKTEEGRGR
jgi:O-methyltransferase